MSTFEDDALVNRNRLVGDGIITYKFMRQVLSLSLPPEINKKIKIRSKTLGFDSVSSYIKYLVNSDDDLIGVDEILKAAKQAKKDYDDGKIIKATSIAELL